jgi:tripartite-type tricarboxylate transporter receptor subunit TctC
MLNSFVRPLRALLVVAGLAAAGSAWADGPTHLVVAFPPGGPADSLARVLAKELGTELNTAIIVENKPGANGAIAANYVMRSPADGTVLWLTSAGALAINPSLYPKLAYDPQKDFAPVAFVVNTPEVLVVGMDNPAKSAAEFVTLARDNKGKPATIASSGIGSMPHMAIALLQQSTKVDFLHVAYKGAAPAITDTMGGHVSAFFGDVSGLMPFINEKRLKALGVAAPQRLKALPDVPTMAELGVKDVEASNWYGVVAPAGTPPATIERLNAAITKASLSPEMVKSLEIMGVEPTPLSAEKFKALIASDTEKWTRVVKAGNIQAE